MGLLMLYHHHDDSSIVSTVASCPPSPLSLCMQSPRLASRADQQSVNLRSLEAASARRCNGSRSALLSHRYIGGALVWVRLSLHATHHQSIPRSADAPAPGRLLNEEFASIVLGVAVRWLGFEFTPLTLLPSESAMSLAWWAQFNQKIISFPSSPHKYDAFTRGRAASSFGIRFGYWFEASVMVWWTEGFLWLFSFLLWRERANAGEWGVLCSI